MRCLEALGCWSELEKAGLNSLFYVEEKNTTVGVGLWNLNGNKKTTISSTVPNSYLDLTPSEAEKYQKIAQMTARASCALG